MSVDPFVTPFDHHFRVLYADPPWTYRNVRSGGSLRSGAAQQYPTLSLTEIATLPVADVMHPSSACFLWATTPLLPDAFTVLKAWEYEYKTIIVWHKASVDLFGNTRIRLGMGAWLRPATEFLLVGVRGQVPPFRLAESNVVHAYSGGHSVKPAVVRQLVDRAADQVFYSPRKLELFARKAHDGWHCLGNAIDGRDIRTALIDLAANLQPRSAEDSAPHVQAVLPALGLGHTYQHALTTLQSTSLALPTD